MDADAMWGNVHHSNSMNIGVEDGAVAEAVLAVAFELRTASLIAYAAQNTGALVEGADLIIRERLGMPNE